MKVHASLTALTAGTLLSLAACSSFDGRTNATNETDAGGPSADASSDANGDANGDATTPVTGTPCSFDSSRIDLPGNGLDEDCSGKPDDDNALCDSSLPLTSVDALDGAKAIGLCKKVDATGKTWGVIDAHYVLPDGTATTAANAVSWGLLPSFGVNTAPSGAVALALSTGAARAANQASYSAPAPGLAKTYSHALPAGFAAVIPACGGLPLSTTASDGIALELRLRAPSNAKSFSFAHQFFTTDYGDSACSAYNDVFAVLMDPKPSGSPDGNVVLDAQGGALTTNATSLMRVCVPGVHNGLTFACPLAAAMLAGTGFEGYGSTGWLRTTVPVAGGAEIKIRFAIWDSGDHLNDSTVLIDSFTFSTQSVSAIATAPK